MLSNPTMLTQYAGTCYGSLPFMFTARAAKMGTKGEMLTHVTQWEQADNFV